MRLRACLILACVALAGCQHLPEGVTVDLTNGMVAVGPCRCRLGQPEAPKEEAPPAEPAPGGDAPR